MIVMGSVLNRALPAPWAIWLEGAGLNVGMFLFMTMSTLTVSLASPDVSPHRSGL
jgi:hypothetical protein